MYDTLPMVRKQKKTQKKMFLVHYVQTKEKNKIKRSHITQFSTMTAHIRFVHTCEEETIESRTSQNAHKYIYIVILLFV